MTTQPETKQLPTETFQEMDRRDEGQILAEMRGEQLAEYVYSTRIEGRQVTNLSYLGVKEAIRRRGHVEILEIRTEQDDKEFRAIVRVRDQDNQIDVLGASTCEKTKPFAWTLAVNKAERNAWMKLIPSKWIAALISEWISRQGGSNATTTVVTSRSRDQPGITNQPNIPTAATTSPNVRAATGFWTVPRTKDQATPEQAQEGLKQIPLLKGTQSYGMINVSGNQLSLVPEHPIPTDTGIIDGFLIRRVLDPMQQKHDFEYTLETTQDGQLKAILIRGLLQDKQFKELVNATRWAFQKSLESPTGQPKT